MIIGSDDPQPRARLKCWSALSGGNSSVSLLDLGSNQGSILVYIPVNGETSVAGSLVHTR